MEEVYLRILLILTCISFFFVRLINVEALSDTLVVYVAAHPDDIEIGMAGSLYKHDVGVHPILWIVLTDGGADSEEYLYDLDRGWIQEDAEYGCLYRTPSGEEFNRGFYSASLSKSRIGSWIGPDDQIYYASFSHDSSLGEETDWRTRVQNFLGSNVIEMYQGEYWIDSGTRRHYFFPDGALYLYGEEFEDKAAERIAWKIDETVVEHGLTKRLLYINSHAPWMVASNSHENKDHNITGNAVRKAVIDHLVSTYGFGEVRVTWYTIYDLIRPIDPHEAYDDYVTQWKQQKSDITKACWAVDFLDYKWNVKSPYAIWGENEEDYGHFPNDPLNREAKVSEVFYGTYCDDSDVSATYPDGKNYKAKGTVSGYLEGDEYSHTDECTGTYSLKEHYCIGPTNQSTTIDCRILGSGYKCFNAKCYVPVTSGGGCGGGRDIRCTRLGDYEFPSYVLIIPVIILVAVFTFFKFFVKRMS